MSKTDFPKEPITDETMQTLDRILKEWCTEAGVGPSSPQAHSIARTLVDWFEFGVRDEEELGRLIRDDDVELADAAEINR